ncbi:MAG: PTS sugar transporter subunit IIA [Planctomycetes bacterium]|nr:PTS sugar transporter subunit IIA [Planctomycetota bacterium]
MERDMQITTSLKDLIRPEDVVDPIGSVDLHGALKELVDHLVERGVVGEGQRGPALRAFLEREELGSTAVGGGMALPHIRARYVERVVAVVGRSRQGIDYNAPDRDPVHVVVMLVSPRDDSEIHLTVLRKLARVLRDRTARRFLVVAPDPAAICEIFHERD